ncbi:unnamed protein product [Notodromas monacha]|uniref:Uncharacterized protein n=1 Tax=Notodromas monacha TaxID=399045 RepID=A0A7R9G9H5_9CRUS|nr:unnamed protein product [Notodromas monacha]CAG0912622.1 unnamed protein product [Notodromas monacha]
MVKIHSTVTKRISKSLEARLGGESDSTQTSGRENSQAMHDMNGALNSMNAKLFWLLTVVPTIVLILAGEFNWVKRDLRRLTDFCGSRESSRFDLELRSSGISLSYQQASGQAFSPRLGGDFDKRETCASGRTAMSADFLTSPLSE